MIHLLATAALATPCDEVLELLARGVPTPSVTDVVRTDTWTAGEVECLDRAGAPRPVIVAASRTAQIAPPPDDRGRRWELALGSGWIPSRRIETLATVDMGVTWFPAERLGLSVQGQAGVQPGGPVRKGLTQQLFEAPSAPLSDELQLAGALGVQFVPVQGELHAGRTVMALGGYLLAGTGLVDTLDSDVLGELRGYDDRFVSTQLQTHPMLVLGGGFRVAFSDAFGLRLQVDQARWIEVYTGTLTENRHREALSAALTLRPARRGRRR